MSNCLLLVPIFNPNCLLVKTWFSGPSSHTRDQGRFLGLLGHFEWGSKNNQILCCLVDVHITGLMHWNIRILIILQKHDNIGQCHEKIWLMHANNKCTDQPAQMRRLIGAFVIHFLESIIDEFATYKISIF